MEAIEVIKKKKLFAPKLRFKEFDEEWKYKKLDDVVEKVNSGKTPLGGESVYVPDGILFIRSQNILDSKLSFENSTFITEEVNNTMKNSIVKPKDILLNITGASLGRSCVVPDNFSIGNVNQHVCIIRLTKGNDPYFLQPIFASEKGQNIFTSLQTGSGREGLNFQSIKSISLSFPSLPEQQKIASFLSAVDEKIQQLSRKKELLEQYKKGVMQQLFSGKLRFKNEKGKAYPKWEEKRLGDVATNIGYGMNSASTTYDGTNKYIRITDIDEDSRAFVPCPLTSPEGDLDSRYLVKSGDILFARTGASVGKSYLYNEKDGTVYFAGFLIRFSINSANSNFIFSQTLTSSYRKWVKIMSMRSGQPGINAEEYKLLKILLPHIEEQNKISTYLSNIDNKIEIVTKQITQTQIFKKGLLQQLFV